jgi:hypothetical protein
MSVLDMSETDLVKYLPRMTLRDLYVHASTLDNCIRGLTMNQKKLSPADQEKLDSCRRKMDLIKEENKRKEKVLSGKRYDVLRGKL